MVDLVDVLIERSPMERAVHPVMPCILQHEENGDLVRDCGPGWEGNAGVHAAHLSHWVEEPDLRKFDGEMTEEDEFRAGPLLFDGWDLLPLDLVLVEIGYAVNYNPRQRATEVDTLVHDEGHDAGCEDIVLHVGIPALNVMLVGVEWRSRIRLLTAHKRSKMFK